MQRLEEKRIDFKATIEEGHRPKELKGLLLPTRVISAEDKICTPLTGNHENVSIWSAANALSDFILYSVTKDQAFRDSGNKVVTGMHELQNVTEQPGLLARSFKSGDETWSQDFFWIKKGDKTRQGNEWHQKESGVRWLGDASKSQVFGATMTYAAALLFGEPDAAQKKVMAQYFCAIVDRIIKSNGRIVDADKKVTGYGNYNPKQYWGFGGIGPQLMLVNLKLAALLTEGDHNKHNYQAMYEQKVKEGYLDLVKRNRANIPIHKNLTTSFGSDDNLAFLNAFLLSELDKFGGKPNPLVQQACAQSVIARWNVVTSPQNALFSFIYHGITQQPQAAGLQVAISAMENFPSDKNVPLVALKAELLPFKDRLKETFFSTPKDIKDWPKDEYAWRWNAYRPAAWNHGIQGNMQFTGIDYNLAYAIGRFYNFIQLPKS